MKFETVSHAPSIAGLTGGGGGSPVLLPCLVESFKSYFILTLKMRLDVGGDDLTGVGPQCRPHQGWLIWWPISHPPSLVGLRRCCHVGGCCLWVCDMSEFPCEAHCGGGGNTRKRLGGGPTSVRSQQMCEKRPQLLYFR